MISLSGDWRVELQKRPDSPDLSNSAVKVDSEAIADFPVRDRIITLPGTIGGSGLGEKITKDTEWFSGLYNPFWFEREEYKSGTGEDFKVPFLSQPRTYYAGKAVYERDFEISEEMAQDNNVSCWYLLIEISKWRISCEIDGESIGEDESLCAPFLFGPVRLAPGRHHIRVIVDNSMLYPYRPDSHSVSDCLEAGWNGMAGKICLIDEKEKLAIEEERRTYAAEHPVSVEVIGRNIVVNGKAEYLRGTHFGGGFHETVYPPFDRPYWERLMETVKEWGFNFIRFHSFCPPEAAFAAADDAGVLVQVECGMWNVFGADEREDEAVSKLLDPWVKGKTEHFRTESKNEESDFENVLAGLDYDKAGMFGVLMKETYKILKWFGHHPSFIMLSPTNEPGGEWYGILKKWVIYAKKINSGLGYEGRRLFTAQSGWFYDTPPADISGTDYIYFHRSAYGLIHGGMIRNRWGWRGKDYTPSLEGCRLPVLAHEMGQWCSYPDFDVIGKFTGGIRGGNYEIYRDQAADNGVLKFNKDFVYASGRAQLRLLKEDFEANFRTKEIIGFEYLDLHDYAGQGTAQVGILDAFLDSKGYTTPVEFRSFNSEIVVLSRIDGYVYKNTDTLKVKFEVCNFSGKDICDARLTWKIRAYSDENERTGLIEEALKNRMTEYEQLPEKEISTEKSTFGNRIITDKDKKKRDIQCFAAGTIEGADILAGQNTFVGSFEAELSQIEKSTKALLTAALVDDRNNVVSVNYWDLTVFAEETNVSKEGITKSVNSSTNAENIYVADGEEIVTAAKNEVYFVRTAEEAEQLLKDGKNVVFSPYMSDMDFECPPLGIRNIFWNAQMGPSWSRPLGIIADTGHPVFRHFPTEKAGGWEWEDILDHARGFWINPEYENIVRVVDDWNRNFPLSLIFEGRVFNGRLLFCSADLSGTFAERPAAATLKKALLDYAASGDFKPAQEIEWTDVLRHLKPLYKGMDIFRNVTVKAICNNESEDDKKAESIGSKPVSAKNVDNDTNPLIINENDLQTVELPEEEMEKLTDINPNVPFRYEPTEFPVCFRIQLKEKVGIERLYVLPIQNDRDFPGVIREYGIRVNGREFRGEWKNGFETRYSEFINETADKLEFIVYSTYSMGYATRWYEEKDGYYKRTELEPLQITVACLGIEYNGTSGGNGVINDIALSTNVERNDAGRDDTDILQRYGYRRNDAQFWKAEIVRLNVTIEQ
ncbi:MAG: hypothetical protein J6Y89_01060 [Lachnospiraceae bacterium]|nr:hypothetical protein [Lachnospiraceae bacterium]